MTRPGAEWRPGSAGPGVSPPTALSIAGTDSGGGAGITADLRAFTACGVHGCVAVAAVTVQNSVGVTGFHEVPPAVVADQIRTVAGDMGVAAAKTGMLASTAIIEAVAGACDEVGIGRGDTQRSGAGAAERGDTQRSGAGAAERGDTQRSGAGADERGDTQRGSAGAPGRHRTPLVVDPVAASMHGDSLLAADALDAVRTVLFPRATLVTPNLDEIRLLVEVKVTDAASARDAARALVALGAGAALVKGGHLAAVRGRADPDVTDLLYDGTDFHELTGPRHDTPHTHGGGDSLASAITAGLARGMSLVDAVGLGKAYIARAVRHAYPLGAGHGPVSSLWSVRDWEPRPGH